MTFPPDTSFTQPPSSGHAAARRCLIVGAGPRPSTGLVRLRARSVDGVRPLVIAADGGLTVLREAGIGADLLIGDLDSLARDTDPKHTDLAHAADVTGRTMHGPSHPSLARPGTPVPSPRGIDGTADATRVIRLPHDKDDIDLVSAARWAWSQGAREFTILGASGGRPDMALAALQLSALISTSGGFAVIEDDAWCMAALTEGDLRLRHRTDALTDRFSASSTATPSGWTISVLAFSDRCTGVSLSGLLYTLDDATLVNTSSRWTSNETIEGQDPFIRVGHGTLAVIWPSGLEPASWRSERASRPADSIGRLDFRRSTNLTDNGSADCDPDLVLPS